MLKNNDKTKERRVSLVFRVSFSFFLFYKTVQRKPTFVSHSRGFSTVSRLHHRTSDGVECSDSVNTVKTEHFENQMEGAVKRQIIPEIKCIDFNFLKLSFILQQDVSVTFQGNAVF